MKSTFYILVRAHDIIWKDRHEWSPRARIEACRILWERAIRVAEDKARASLIS